MEKGDNEMGRGAFSLHLGPLCNFCIIRLLLNTITIFLSFGLLFWATLYMVGFYRARHLNHVI